MITAPRVVTVYLNQNATTGIEVPITGVAMMASTRVTGLEVAFDNPQGDRFRINEGELLQPGFEFTKLYIFRPEGNANLKAELYVLQSPNAAIRRMAASEYSQGVILGRYTSAAGQFWRGHFCNRSPSDPQFAQLRLVKLHMQLITAASRVLMQVSTRAAYAALAGAAVTSPIWQGGTAADRPDLRLELLDAGAGVAATAGYYVVLESTSPGNGYACLDFTSLRSGGSDPGITLGKQQELRVHALTAGAFDIAITGEFVATYV